jgi:hypothetical protein
MAGPDGGGGQMKAADWEAVRLLLGLVLMEVARFVGVGLACHRN